MVFKLAKCRVCQGKIDNQSFYIFKNLVYTHILWDCALQKCGMVAFFFFNFENLNLVTLDSLKSSHDFSKVIRKYNCLEFLSSHPPSLISLFMLGYPLEALKIYCTLFPSDAINIV